ncbi:hypothetical protein Gpo141_00008551 [Globisporangium polare]
MKSAGVLLQIALVAALATSSAVAVNANTVEDFSGSMSMGSGSMYSDADLPAPSLSGSFDGSQGDAPIHCRRNRLWDGSGSRFAGSGGSFDESYDYDVGSQSDDNSGFLCGPRFPGSGSGGSGDSSGSHSGRRHFRGDVGDDYDFGSGDGSFDPFDASGSGGSGDSSGSHSGRRHFRGDVGDDYDFGSGDGSLDGSGSSSSFVPHRHRRHHHHHHGSQSASGSHALYGDVGEWSGSFDSSSSRGFSPHGNWRGSDSGDPHRLRGSGPDHTN